MTIKDVNQQQETQTATKRQNISLKETKNHYKEIQIRPKEAQNDLKETKNVHKLT